MRPACPDRRRPAGDPSDREGPRRSRRRDRGDDGPSRPPRWCDPPGIRRFLRSSVCAWTKRAMLRARRRPWQPAPSGAPGGGDAQVPGFAAFGFFASAAGFEAASASPFFSAGFASDFSSFGFSAGGSFSPAMFRCDSLSFLKSVSYQPPPFSRKTGAETRRRSLARPQAGHFRSGRSATFCSSSW